MPEVKDLNDKRMELGRLTKQQRDLLTKAEAENREFTAEENAEYDRIDVDVEKIDRVIQAASATEERKRKLTDRESRMAAPQRPGLRPAVVDDEPGSEERDTADYFDLSPELRAKIKELKKPEYRKAYGRFLVRGREGMNPDERRALSMGTGAGGAYTVPQEEFIQELLKSVDNKTPFASLARTFDIPQAQSLGAPALGADPDDADWTTELATGNEDPSMAFERRELVPIPLAKRLKVSDRLLRASPLGIEGIVRDRLAYKWAVPVEKACMTGTGVAQALGIFTASALGISTSRDVTVSTSSALDADKLIDARYTLREGYDARWILHRTTLAAVRKLKATTGDYVWQPGLTAGAPSTLLDYPYTLDEYAPSFATAGGSYVAVLGDPKYYWVARALGFTIKRLDELYAETNQVGFIIRGEVDGMPVLEDAFIRCKM